MFCFLAQKSLESKNVNVANSNNVQKETSANITCNNNNLNQQGINKESESELTNNKLNGENGAQVNQMNHFSSIQNVRANLNKVQQQYHLVEGVWLSDKGLQQIKNLTMELPKRTRMKRGMRAQLLLKAEENDDLKEDDSIDKIDDEMNGIKTENGENGERKKRKRRLHKVGIGGFAVKSRGRGSMSKDDDMASTEFDIPSSDIISGNTDVAIHEKPRRRRRIKKRNQLQDTFPQYMQEAFFGKILLDTSKEVVPTASNISCDRRTSLIEMPCDDELTLNRDIGNDKIINLTPSEIAAVKMQKSKSAKLSSRSFDDASKSSLNDDDLQDSEALQELLTLPPLPADDELMDMLMNDEDGLNRHEESLDEMAVNVRDAEENANDAIESVLPVLSPHFNLESMVGESGLPQMDSKDVEDIFKGVLSPHQNEENDDLNSILGPPPPQPPLGPHNNKRISMPIPPPPLTTPLIPSPQNIIPASNVPLPQLTHSKQSPCSTPTSQNMDSPFNISSASSFSGNLSESLGAQYSPQITEPQSPWPLEHDNDNATQSQKNLQKWEADEALNNMATISPVLYANLKHPNLKNDYPIWTDRIKQIHKLWRQLPSDQRQPYLQMARENRAASRIQKAQADSRGGKDIKPNVSGLRDPELERQWKNLQASRQQQQLQQQQAIQDQRQDQMDYQMEFGQMMPQQQQPQQPNAPKMPVQAQFSIPMNRGKVPQPTTPGSAPLSPVIQVSRVRPPIDPHRLPVSVANKPHQFDPYTHQPATPRPQSAPHQVNVRPATPQQQRSPFSPSSPIISHPPQSMTPSSNEVFHTPPTTPRPQSSESFNTSSQGLPMSPYAMQQQPRTPMSSPSPFSPNNNIMAQTQQPHTSDPYAVPPSTPRPQQPFHNEGYSGQQLSQQTHDNFAQPLPPRSDHFSPQSTVSVSSSDNFSRPSPVATSQQNDPYARPPLTPRPQQTIQRSQFDDIYSHPVGTPRPGVQHHDSYLNSQEQTRPTMYQQQDSFAYQSQQRQVRPGMNQVRQPDPYIRSPSTPMPPPPPPPPSVSQDPYAKQPGTPMPPPIDRHDMMDNGQFSRQHLRDLLQRNQTKRLNDQLRPEQQPIQPRAWTGKFLFILYSFFLTNIFFFFLFLFRTTR